jgi:ribonuclease HI
MSRYDPIVFMSVNVARSHPRLSTILNSSFDSVDILYVQEPWYGRIGVGPSDDDPDGEEVLGTQRHQGWVALEPLSSGRPQVSAYVNRRRARHLNVQLDDVLPANAGLLGLQVSIGKARLRTANVYNRGSAPTRRAGIDAVMSSAWGETADDHMLSGDFNLHHPMWEGADRQDESPASRDLADWAEANDMALASTPGAPTRRGQDGQRDSTIDLVWASTEALAWARVSEVEVAFDSSVGSDHAALTWTWSPSRSEAADRSQDLAATGYVIDPAERDEWMARCAEQLQNAPPADLSEVAGLDREAETLVAAMSAASAAVFKPRRVRKGEVQKWWNADCDHAAKRVKEADCATERKAAHHRLRHVIRKAKREWADTITAEASSSDIWGFVNWGSGKARKPPLGRVRRTDGTYATSPEDKADVFYEAYFPADRPHVDVIQPDDPPPRPTRTFADFTPEELTEALAPTSNVSAPGVDGNSYRLLKWLVAGHAPRVLAFLNACIRLGYSPRRLGVSINVVIGKPGKKDKEDPKSSRTIALLVTLAKLLEKMVNNRMQHDAAALGLLPPNQFGCRQKSSTLDAGLALTHDIEVAWSKNWSASLITFDISGFFDRVDHARLCHTLTLMGFAPCVVKWVRSWLLDRQVCFLIDGVRVEPRPCDIGVPQGSPLSPILSALYTAFVVGSPIDDDHAAMPFYVDDGAILTLGPLLTQNTRRGEKIFEDKAQRLWRIGLPCPPVKSDAMHFTRRVGDFGSPAYRLWTPEGHKHHVAPKDVIRWLGFFLDRKLTYKRHVEIRCNRASSTIQALRILGNSARGLEARHFRQLINACVITKATYGVQLWYGRGGGRSTGLVQQLQAVQNKACRLILGAFKTSPLEVCGYLASLPPMRVRIERMCDRSGVRLRTIPRSAPPVQRAYRMWNETPDAQLPILPVKRHPRSAATRAKAARPISRLEAIAARAGVKSTLDERITPFAVNPWERHLEQRWDRRFSAGAGLGVPKKGRVKEVRLEAANLSMDDATLVTWTDGSRMEMRGHSIVPGWGRVGGVRVARLSRPAVGGRICIAPSTQARTGAAYATTRAGVTQHTARIGLGPKADNYDGELAALAAAASYAAARSNADHSITRWVFYTDNSSAVQTIGDSGARPGQQYAQLFGAKVDEFLAGRIERTVEVRWTPAHVGIEGNELADKLAKEATRLPPVMGSTVTWALAESTRRAAAAWKSEWKKWRRPNAWWAPATRKAPSLKPSAFQAVLGHAFTGEYYERFVPSESPRCRCGLHRETNAHALLYCTASADSRRAAFTRFKIKDRSLEGVLGTTNGLRAIANMRPAFSKSER